MIGKQAVNSLMEMSLPLFYKWLNTVRVHVGLERDDGETRKDSKNNRYASRVHLQWVKDYKLVEWGPRSLFPEYLEMSKFIFQIEVMMLILSLYFLE